MSLALYRGATRLAGPLVDRYLAARLAQGKEDAARLAERRGVASRPRPAGFLTWLHGASVGEAISALPLVERLTAHGSVLLTTGTVTSARLIAERLPAGALHQYVPADRPDWVASFLDHWRPDLALWLESELWPNLVMATHARGTPMVLVNARMSARSAARWRWLPWTIRPLLGAFDLCLAQGEESAARFRALGARAVRAPGNLKFAAPPLPVDDAALAMLKAAIGDRPCWLAASTHPGEEAIAGAVHQTLATRHPGLLTIIAPRHPARGPEIAAALPGRVRCRSAGEAPDGDIYVADTLGELGLFYRLAPVVLIGGSLVPHGGQNLLEPARLGAAVLHGPHMANFPEALALLGDALTPVTDAATLTTAVDALLADPARRARLGAVACERATQGAGALDAVLAALAPYLPRDARA
jgi:3-deoxy-D-manno-octulosonic-acid transferase